MRTRRGRRAASAARGSLCALGLMFAAVTNTQALAAGAVTPQGDPQKILGVIRVASSAGHSQTVIQMTPMLLGAAPETRVEALLYRALAHYRLQELDTAEHDLRLIVATLPRALDSFTERDEEARSAEAPWPPEFRDWVASMSEEVSSGPGTVELPDVSLEDLDVGSEVRDVQSHFTMAVEVVKIPVIVEDLDGAFVSGLGAADFTVADGPSPTRPASDLISEREPTSIGILIDAGDAMVDKEAEIRFAIAELIAELRPEDEIFLIQFADEAVFLSAFSVDRLVLETAMQSYDPGGGRALYDAVALGLIQMRSAQFDKKALIVLAEGDDLNSQTSETAARIAARREGVSVHALVLASGVRRWRPSTGPDAREAQAEIAPMNGVANVLFLQELVHNTGGMVALRPTVDTRFGGLSGWLGRACSDVTDYINNQYLILFRSLDPPPHGEWRSLGVHVDLLHGRVRARSGYVR